MATQGMLQFGQKELVLCLKQYSNDHIKSAIEIFRIIIDLTAQGQLVDVNGLSEFSANGLFDKPNFTGIAYARSHNIEPVLQTIGVEKQHVLSMVLLTPGEVAVMKCFGLARVLSRICADSRYFPYPLWNDLDRTEAIGQDEIGKCYLQNFSQYPGVFAVRDEQGVQVFFDRKLAPVLITMFREKPAAIFATEIVPGNIDGLLVWRPDSENIVINTPQLFAVEEKGQNTDDTVNLLGGCYILIGHDPENNAQGVTYSDDGFFATLNLQGMMIFMNALETQQPCLIEGLNGEFNLGVGWVG